MRAIADLVVPPPDDHITRSFRVDAISRWTATPERPESARYVRFTSEFPTTVTGKIQKFRMREISIEELGLGQGGGIG